MNNKPLRVEWIPALLGDKAGHRLMIVFAAPGCEWAFKTGGCTNCSFPSFFGTKSPVSTAELMAQLDEAVTHVPDDDRGPVQVDLFVSGSFFNPDEIPVEAQRLVLERTARMPRVRRIVAETRPEFVTPEVMAMAMTAGDGVPLEIGIGLESANKEIRQNRIRKGFSWRQFAEAARLISAANAELLVYLLLKPIDTTEAEAIDDLAFSSEKVFSLSRELDLPTRIALEPCFIAPETAIEKAYLDGRYRPPWLWSIIEALKRASHLGRFQVGLSDEGQDTAMAAHNCDNCSGRVRAALARFNVDQNIRPLELLRCPCQREWELLISE